MSVSVISVENLGKRYRIKHQQQGGMRYKALRDVLADKTKGIAGRLWSAVRPTSHSALRSPHSEDFWALKNVSFDVKRGETLGIVGRNGAGKSTLLKILSRITEPTEGRVRIKGRVASLLEVGTGFHPELTGRENIFLNGAILGMTRAEIKKRFDEIVAFAEVEKFLDTPVKRYSSGMYVRLAFAVAAHLEPEILIVDEVLAVGDSLFQQKCLGKMSEVAHGGRTILFVSHNMDAIRNFCSRGLLLVSGYLELDGSVSEAIREYSEGGKVNSVCSWSRPDDMARPPMAFETIYATLEGQQPRILLKCEIALKVEREVSPVFIAADICDQLSTPIMQALPITKPFICGTRGTHRLSLEIDLPPLIPGRYVCDFWVGSHFTTTVDYVKGVIAFDISDSPSSGRSYPHSPGHGFLVPDSRCQRLFDS